MTTYDYSGYAFRKSKRIFFMPKKTVVVIIAVALVLVLLSVLIASAVSPNTVSYKGFVLYAVQTGGYTNEQSAQVASTRIVNAGGCGNIVYDKVYRVIAAVYVNRSDADSVVDKLKLDGLHAQVYVLSCQEKEYSVRCTKKTERAAENLYESIIEEIQTLIGEAVDLDRGDISDKEIAQRADNTIDELKDGIDSLSGNDDTGIYRLVTLSESVIAELEILCDEVTSLNVRIAYTDILLAAKDFLEQE